MQSIARLLTEIDASARRLQRRAGPADVHRVIANWRRTGGATAPTDAKRAMVKIKRAVKALRGVYESVWKDPVIRKLPAHLRRWQRSGKPGAVVQNPFKFPQPYVGSWSGEALSRLERFEASSKDTEKLGQARQATARMLRDFVRQARLVGGIAEGHHARLRLALRRADYYVDILLRDLEVARQSLLTAAGVEVAPSPEFIAAIDTLVELLGQIVPYIEGAAPVPLTILQGWQRLYTRIVTRLRRREVGPQLIQSLEGLLYKLEMPEEYEVIEHDILAQMAVVKRLAAEHAAKFD